MFEAVQRSKTVDRVLEVTTGAGLGIAEMLSRDKERFSDLRSDRDAALAACSDMEKCPRGWAGLSYAEMIRAVNNRDVQDQLYFVYRQIYFSFSEYAHPTPTAIRHAIPGAQRTGATRLRRGQHRSGSHRRTSNGFVAERGRHYSLGPPRHR